MKLSYGVQFSCSFVLVNKNHLVKFDSQGLSL
jgi:hypothetical protein